MGLFVIGIPRSGALPIAQALALRYREAGGTSLVTPDPIANRGRPHPLTAANDELLGELGASWLTPPAASSPVTAGAASRSAQATSAMRSAFGDRPWLWADPRLAITLPYWLDAAGDADVLVVLGDPDQLDEALAEELGLPAGYGRALHRRSSNHLMAAIAGHERCVVLDGSEAAATAATELLGGAPLGLITEHAADRSAVPDGEETDADRLVFGLAAQMLDHADLDRRHIANLRRLNADAERRAGAARELPDRLAAAETGAAETAADFEEFKQRRSIRTITRLADRFYPAAQSLRNRFSGSARSEDGTSDADPRALTASATGLGAAARRGDLAQPLTVIVPVYNAPEEVSRCLDALVANTPAGVGVLLIDDGSSDPGVAPLLEGASTRPGWRVLTNEDNLGFTRTVNRGLAEVPEGDVILLNADTRVGPQWTWRLRNAVYADPRHGTATPLSDNAGAFSFPCVRPKDQEAVDAVATSVARGAGFARPDGPTGNGFCMYIPARSRALVPTMDEVAFPRGYGEENDFCMKLVAAGLTHVIADDCVVFHDESASFGSEKQALLDRGLATLAERWPDYQVRVQRFLESPSLAEAREAARISAAAPGASSPQPTRVLFVSHDGQGGTQHHCDDLAASLQGDHQVFLLTPSGRALVLKRWEPGGWREIQRWHPAVAWSVDRFRSDEMTDAMADLLNRLDIDVVHVHHLVGQTFDVVEVAVAMGLPVVVTVHDYYLACPTLNLLDETGTFCGGTCTPGDGDCQTPEPWVPSGTPLKHNLVHPWQAETTRLLVSATAIVAPSKAARSVLASALDPELALRIQVIEHGLDVTRAEVAAAPYADSPIKIVVAGAVSIAKGADALADLIAADTNGELAFEVLGQVDPKRMPHMVDLPVRWHGTYDREHFVPRLARIRPAFVAVLSVWPETYNYVVTESWAAGVPVVTGTLGAPAERVARTGAGVVVDLADPAGAVAAIVAAGRDDHHYNEMVRRATGVPVKITADMAREYRQLYERSMATSGLAPIGAS